jgi:hypothetical protein
MMIKENPKHDSKSGVLSILNAEATLKDLVMVVFSLKDDPSLSKQLTTGCSLFHFFGISMF